MTDSNERAMNDYLRRLRWALAPLPSRDREEIVTELRGHFVERIESGSIDFDAIAAEFRHRRGAGAQHRSARRERLEQYVRAVLTCRREYDNKQAA